MEGTFRILLADDDDVFTMLVGRALRSLPEAEGTELTTVSDGADAVAYLRGDGAYADRAAHPLPDVVLLDQRMRRMDGTEALDAIKAVPALAGLPVCILSTSNAERLRATCYRRGACFFIRKPLEYDELREKLRLLMRFLREVVEVA